jgi:hypothetical protein
MITLDYRTENNAEILEIGEIKISESWTNLFIKFRFEDSKEVWLYYSEHNDKPERLKQIKKFVSGQYKVGDKVTVNYKLVQKNNKSCQLLIHYIAN